MGVDCIIFTATDKAIVEAGNPYLNGSRLKPVERLGGTNGNPDPCYIANAAVLTNPDFAAAQPYLSGLPIKNSSDPDFPPELPSDDE
jgi:hypothetical protein